MSDDRPGADSARDAADRLEDLLGRQDPHHHESATPVDPAADESHEERTETDDDQDADTQAPEAPLFALLTTIERRLTVERIDRIWIFPPRRFEAGETAVVVVAAFPTLDPGRRTVYAAHYTAPAEAAQPTLSLQEFGSAPTDRVGRIVEDVVGRIKDEAPAAPAATRIEGDLQRWHEMRHALAEIHLDQTTRHPRLRHAPPGPRGPS